MNYSARNCFTSAVFLIRGSAGCVTSGHRWTRHWCADLWSQLPAASPGGCCDLRRTHSGQLLCGSPALLRASAFSSQRSWCDDPTLLLPKSSCLDGWWYQICQRWQVHVFCKPLWKSYKWTPVIQNRRKRNLGTLAGVVPTQHSSVTQGAWSFSPCGGWCLVRTTDRDRKHLNLSLPSPEQFSQNKPISCMLLVYFAFKAIYIFCHKWSSELRFWAQLYPFLPAILVWAAMFRGKAIYFPCFWNIHRLRPFWANV